MLLSIVTHRVSYTFRSIRAQESKLLGKRLFRRCSVNHYLLLVNFVAPAREEGALEEGRAGCTEKQHKGRALFGLPGCRETMNVFRYKLLEVAAQCRSRAFYKNGTPTKGAP